MSQSMAEAMEYAGPDWGVHMQCASSWGLMEQGEAHRSPPKSEAGLPARHLSVCTPGLDSSKQITYLNGDMLTKKKGTCLELTKSVVTRTREYTGTLNNA